jgi:uncharacterized protein
MKLDDEQESANVEDRRGSGRGLGGAKGVGIGTIILALIASYFLGIDPRTLIGVAETVQGMQTSGSSGASSGQGAPLDAANDPMHAYKVEVSKILNKTENTWTALFREMGGQYQKPKLVLFTGATPTACGTGQTAMGPFYCPGDQKVYLDMQFFDEMARRFRADGDFARAYVIAHEVGHHVQNLLGITQKTDALRGKMSEVQYNKVSVRVELQADCFAGVWAHHANKARPFMEAGDIEKALVAARAIGDDALQRAARGAVVPDSFTHGTSAQRTRWLTAGFESGDLKACDTFSLVNI